MKQTRFYKRKEALNTNSLSKNSFCNYTHTSYQLVPDFTFSENCSCKTCDEAHQKRTSQLWAFLDIRPKKLKVCLMLPAVRAHLIFTVRFKMPKCSIWILFTIVDPWISLLEVLVTLMTTMAIDDTYYIERKHMKLLKNNKTNIKMV